MNIPLFQSMLVITITDKELQLLLEEIKGHELEPLILVAAYYGLRRGELLGLGWQAICFAKKTIIINHAVVECSADGKYALKKRDVTKNSSSNRTFPLTEDFEELFRKVKKQQLDNKELLGNAYYDGDADYVFVNPMGNIDHPDYISCAFKKLLKKCKLRVIKLHEIRHSCASILISIGYGLKDVQEWLGHSDISVTGNIYAHLETKRKTEMARQFAQQMMG